MPFAMAQLASTLVKELPHILAKMWDSEEADGDEAQNGRLSDAICLGVAGAQPSNRTLAHVDQNVFLKCFQNIFLSILGFGVKILFLFIFSPPMNVLQFKNGKVNEW